MYNCTYMCYTTRKEIMAIVYNQSIGPETTYKYFLLVKLSIPLNVRITMIFLSFSFNSKNFQNMISDELHARF